MRLRNIKTRLCRKSYLRVQIFALSFLILFASPVLGFQESETAKPPRADQQSVSPKPPPTSQKTPPKKIRSPKFDEVVINAFKSAHDGYSSDEIILNEKLNDGFVKACQAQLATTEIPDASAFDLNWRLMNLRKAGKLNVKSTRSNRTSTVEVAHVAEIAAREMHDRHSISSDQVMALSLIHI